MPRPLRLPGLPDSLQCVSPDRSVTLSPTLGIKPQDEQNCQLKTLTRHVHACIIVNQTSPGSRVRSYAQVALFVVFIMSVLRSPMEKLPSGSPDSSHFQKKHTGSRLATLNCHAVHATNWSRNGVLGKAVNPSHTYTENHLFITVML